MADPTKDPALIGQIFNERGLLLAILGGMGGMVRSAVLRTTWREGLRVIVVGGVTSFGVGEFGPPLLGRWIDDMPEDLGGTIGTLCAAAFVIGLFAVTILERVLAQKGDGNGSA